MENKAHALAAGLFVLLVSALLVAMALWLTRDVTNTTNYEMTTADGVTGLQVQAAVRYKGVAVGKVTDITFDPREHHNVLVTIAVSPQAPITASTFATLAFQGVTGLSFIQLDDNGNSTQPPAPGPDGVPRIPLRPNPLGQISDQAGALIGKVDQAMDRLNELLAPENQAKLTQALTEVGAAAASANQLARTADHTLRTQLDPARADLPGLIRQASQTLKATEGAANDVRRTLTGVDAMVGDARQGLTRLTGPGGVLERADESANTVNRTTLPKIQNLTEDASRTIRRLDRIANTLGENPQALLYGSGAIAPGPGEPGFVAPAATGAAASH
ncbi:MlaD family protein [Ottowia sp.]|uniref:MlaD family protein n=1 Tax=Ottowia sp. TaxID=1898956 RepID=UPI0025EE93B7|nr:MlaD family protein [Ottowia sp.]